MFFVQVFIIVIYMICGNTLLLLSSSFEYSHSKKSIGLKSKKSI